MIQGKARALSDPAGQAKWRKPKTDRGHNAERQCHLGSSRYFGPVAGAGRWVTMNDVRPLHVWGFSLKAGPNCHDLHSKEPLVPLTCCSRVAATSDR